MGQVSFLGFTRCRPCPVRKKRCVMLWWYGKAEAGWKLELISIKDQYMSWHGKTVKLLQRKCINPEKCTFLHIKNTFLLILLEKWWISNGISFFLPMQWPLCYWEHNLNMHLDTFKTWSAQGFMGKFEWFHSLSYMCLTYFGYGRYKML